MTDEQSFLAFVRKMGMDPDGPEHWTLRPGNHRTESNCRSIGLAGGHFLFNLDGSFLGTEAACGMGHDPFTPKIIAV